MSSAAGSSGITSQIWQRLVRQGDTNSDNNLSKGELDALKAGYKYNSDIEQIIRSFDKDGDQTLSSSELPSSPLDMDMLGPMIDWQEYGKADAATRSEDDKRIVDSLFKRADVDEDGFLSKDEMEAESTLRQTRSLEGKSADSDPFYMIRPDADRDHLNPEDFLVGRRISLDQLKITSPEEIPAEQREVIQKAVKEWENSPDYQKPLTAEEQRQKAVDGVLGTPLSAAYISRLLSQLSAAVAKADPANALRSGGEGIEA